MVGMLEPVKEIINQLLIGFSAVFLAPSDSLPVPPRRITLPPDNAAQALGFDFSRVSRDLMRATERIEHENQLELGLPSKRNSR
jgi:hypothetical protein